MAQHDIRCFDIARLDYIRTHYFCADTIYLHNYVIDWHQEVPLSSLGKPWNISSWDTVGIELIASQRADISTNVYLTNI